MSDLRVKKIVIVGGGTAGWMAAAAMSKLIYDQSIEIKLIESEQIGTVGVGEATIPHILYFNRLVGINEDDFIKKTNATYKLGIEFVNWGQVGESYIHPFGPYGVDMEGVHFHHMWFRANKLGFAPPMDDYNLQIIAAKANKFMRPEPKLEGSPISKIAYAFQFDAALYAKYMRDFAEQRGVKRIEGKIAKTHIDKKTGNVSGVQLDNGDLHEGDLFIDCSGFKGLLIEEALQTGYEDWSHYLPCDRAIARASEKLPTLTPYTRATAKKAGWQWRIPLQTRTGNGHVYSSQFLQDDEALESLNKDLAGAPISDPNYLRFKTGIRKKPWNKNVVSIGLASGFLEPLESTSIHLIQTAIARLMTNFPDKRFNEHDINYYNERTRLEYIQVRDFLILHYKATKRDDSEFWRYCRNMSIPDSLSERMAIYRENARLYRHDNELFNHVSWYAVFNGQGIYPERHHPIADMLPEDELKKRMQEIHRVTQKCLEVMPTHEEYLEKIKQGVVTGR